MSLNRHTHRYKNRKKAVIATRDDDDSFLENFFPIFVSSTYIFIVHMKDRMRERERVCVSKRGRKKRASE